MINLKFSILIFLLSLTGYTQNQNFEYKITDNFFPERKELKGEIIEWGTLEVPEDWNNINGKKVELAVAKIRSLNQKFKKDPIIFIQGGPGGSSLNSIGRWLVHPLRQQSDIILIDLRGTGFSKPSLCPNLGNSFLEILAKNQSKEQDEKDKISAALECKSDLIQRGINLSAYNSNSISNDLNALKVALNIKKWNVYGVSYGTYAAQVYATLFPQDISSMILDSPISDIANYYDKNTYNYVKSLNLLFQKCRENYSCSQEYPDLERIYYEAIQKLKNNPITVKVDKSVISNCEFTYNAEDFKIAIQQSLYQRKLIEILPMLIYEFNGGNEGVLSNLVAAFSGALALDYGTYYCVTCSETIPRNSIIKFDSIAKQYPKLVGGLSFYKSDYIVCLNWNISTDSTNINWDVFKDIPIILFSGDFDPITPSKNAKEIVYLSENAILVEFPTYGHGSSFSKIGKKVVQQFISNPKNVDLDQDKLKRDIQFITDISINKGVAKFAECLNKPDLIFLAPLCLASMVLLGISLSYIFSLLRNYKKIDFNNRLLRITMILTVFFGLGFILNLIFSVINTVNFNFYILAFGLLNTYSYVFILYYVFIALSVLYMIFFVIKYKTVLNTSLAFTALFSLFLLNLYFYYWGFIEL